MEDISNYENLKSDAQKFYNEIGKVSAPAFNQSERERSSQIMRFKLLPRAVKLIKISTTFQEFEETIHEFEIKSFKKKVRKTKQVKYWGVIAIIEGRKIKVIIRKIGDNGNMHFWSIVPDWTTNKYRDAKFISTMKGNPEED